MWTTLCRSPILEYVSRGQKAIDNNKNKEITMKKLLAIFLASTVSLAVHADDHSSAAPNPVETWTCVLNEGKTLDDVRKVGAMVAEVDKAAGNDVAQWIFTPFTGDMEAGLIF